MTEEPGAGITSVRAHGVQPRPGGACGCGPKRQAGGRSAPGPEAVRRRGSAGAGGPPALDDTVGSPTDLADADVSVRRAWGRARMAIAVIVTVAPIVAVLVSWRIRVSRARRRGQFIDF